MCAFGAERTEDPPVIVDSNIIIDGRLKEIAATGFVPSSFVVPHFVLEELQTLADSHDPLKRERGRTALNRLQEMQLDPAFSVTITGTALDPFAAVDSKLVQLAKMTNSRLLTNDSNLCSIARMQGVTALNLNDLSRALRPTLTAGDEIELRAFPGRPRCAPGGRLSGRWHDDCRESRPRVSRQIRPCEHQQRFADQRRPDVFRGAESGRLEAIPANQARNSLACFDSGDKDNAGRDGESFRRNPDL